MTTLIAMRTIPRNVHHPNCAYRSLSFCTSHLFRAMTQPTYIPIMRDHVSKLLVDLPTVGPLETQYFLGTGDPQTLVQRC
jgi:hypothetical protein